MLQGAKYWKTELSPGVMLCIHPHDYYYQYAQG